MRKSKHRLNAPGHASRLVAARFAPLERATSEHRADQVHQSATERAGRSAPPSVRARREPTPPRRIALLRDRSILASRRPARAPSSGWVDRRERGWAAGGALCPSPARMRGTRAQRRATERPEPRAAAPSFLHSAHRGRGEHGEDATLPGASTGACCGARWAEGFTWFVPRFAYGDAPRSGFALEPLPDVA